MDLRRRDGDCLGGDGVIVKEHVVVAGRIGGEKFAVLLEETDLPAAAIFAERLRLKTEATSVSIGDQRVSITVSIGIAAMHDADDTVDQVMQRAELAIFRAKSGGRNSIQTADSRQQTADSKNTAPASPEKNK